MKKLTQKYIDIMEKLATHIAQQSIVSSEENIFEILERISDVIELTTYRASGFTPEYVTELAKAEYEGKLHVLPCKVGDNIYFLFMGAIINQEIDSIALLDGVHYRISLIGGRQFWDDEYGKCWFVYRKEAEAALAGKKE